MIAGLDRSSQVRRRGTVARGLVPGVFLLLELPSLLPVIVGAAVMALVMGARGLAGRLSRGAG
jgi:hypothetical protein